MKVADAHDLKRAQVRLNDIETERASIAKQAATANDTLRKLKLEASTLRATIQRFLSKPDDTAPVITEHAFLRYFERACGFNLDQVAKVILDPATAKGVKAMRNVKFPRDGFTVVAKDGVVVTIETPEGI